MKNEFGYVGWLGEDYLCCQGGLFYGSSTWDFLANGNIAMHVHRHMRKEFHHHFPFYLKTADIKIIKTAVLAVKTNF